MRPLLLLILSCFLLRGSPAAAVDYEQQIRPLLHEKCAACHGALKQSAGLRLDAGALINRGSENGAVVTPGNAAASTLIERVSADVAARMPPEGQGERLTPAQIELLRLWISDGATFPADEKIPEDPAQWWSYQPPERPPQPSVSNAAWVRTPIDAFIAAEQQKHGLSPQPDAPRATWLRRVFLDLIGLPPTRRELQAFLTDGREGAFARVVDGLLERPEYGERWGRHWMDVWRYSDWYGSRGGNEIRYSQRHIWRWRDWIVESLNGDKPYDQMVREMLAGDEISPSDPDVLRATGFLGRNWYKFDRDVWMFETVEQTCQAFLGLTMRCARCHDHKFDPISQEDYYRLRAFFEPHGVRTDPVAASTETEKDATLGQVLSQGVARIYDQNPDAPTFLYQRGDGRYPDKSRPLLPGVPASLGGPEIRLQPVPLDPTARYPQLRADISDGLIAAAARCVEEVQGQLSALTSAAAAAEQLVAARHAGAGEAIVGSIAAQNFVLSDNFSSQSPLWKVVSGTWEWLDGRLIESSVGSFSTIVASVTCPQSFTARVKYRTLKPGNLRSVGFSFDYVDQGNSQDIYTSNGDTKQTVQAFHRKDGQQIYPAAGIVETALKLDDVTTVDVAVRDQQLEIVLNGQSKLKYVLPVPRRDGRFALWVHNGSAEFLDVQIEELVPTLDDLRRQAAGAANKVAAAEAKLSTASAEAASLRARIDAERRKYVGAAETEVKQAALAASLAERQAAVSQAAEAVLAATQHRDAVEQARQQAAATLSAESNPSLPAGSAELAEAETKRNEALAALQKATEARDQPDGTYTPLGEVFPATSTGRRLALARWIVDPQNRRASRVAVNHIWLRHFGEALVPTVANFGLNGQRPSHPELLDWLAAELVQQDWRMKPLHRMIVLSSVYRQSTAGDHNSLDPANRFLWRMNSRRMEAEVVRDAVLYTAGVLDQTRGGPEIPETEAERVLRRSLYFRNTPNEKVAFLETFDIANPNECYRRQESIMPRQALAMMNSSLAIEQARILAEKLSAPLQERDDPAARTEFIQAAFETVLSRGATAAELAACRNFLEHNQSAGHQPNEPSFPAGNPNLSRQPSPVPRQRARENLVHTLYSHNDFVTIR